MDSDTRFVCARDLYEGIEARPVAGAPFRRVAVLTAEGPELVVWFDFDGSTIPFGYKRDDELEVVR